MMPYTAAGSGLVLAVVFIQSGIDKIADYRGNYDWLNGHFSKTFLRKTVGLLLPLLTLMELAGGLHCAAGAVTLFLKYDSGYFLLLTGHVIVLAALACLMLGQRVAKDYAGAASLTGYILITLFGLAMLLR